MRLPPLYVVCDADVCARAGWTMIDFAAACLEGGARLIQIRAKADGSQRLLDTTRQILDRAGDAMVIVNDRADVACAAGAAGVHVGQDDLPPRAVRTILGGTRVVGLSTHTREQIAAAVLEPISYLAVGPVFGTSTKETGYEAVGLARVQEAARVAGHHLPVVAIGGITLDNAPAVIAAGAQSVAVIADLVSAGNPEARVRAYLQRLAV